MTALSTAPRQTMGRLISKVSHDTQNSVRALLHLQDWIKDDLKDRQIELPPDVLGHFDMMATHARRLDRMRADLTTFARIGQCGGDGVIRLNQCITDAIQSLNVPRGFSVTFDLECEEVKAAEHDVSALLKALMSNGIKHHHLGSGRIHIKTRASDGMCVITVSDDGPGIAPQDYPRIFDAMTTLRPRDDVEGSGLGLAIVLKVIDHYDGTLALGQGANGIGSVFEIKLPKC